MSETANDTHRRLRSIPTEVEYKFTHVFPPNTQQGEFFSKTTLPLIRSVLTGQNALLFAYGVTNSGKTYSIQGGLGENEAGILPRTLDILFQSIKGFESNDYFRPVRLSEAEKLSKPSFESLAADNADLLQSREAEMLGRLFAQTQSSTSNAPG
jgi:hypothetical protein